MNVFLISYKEDFTLLSFVSHRGRCNRVLMIPLGEFFACVVCVFFFPLLVFGIKVFYKP